MRRLDTRHALAPALLCAAAVVGVVACGGETPSYKDPPWGQEPTPVASFAGRIVITNSGDDTLSVVDPGAPAAPGRLPIGLNPVDPEVPRHVVADAQGHFLYVNFIAPLPVADSGPHGTHGEGAQPGFIMKLDVATARPIGWMSVDQDPGESTLTADGQTLFLTHYNLTAWMHGGGHLTDPSLRDSQLTIVDTDRLTIRARLPLCPAAHGVRLSPDEQTLYATCVSDEIAVVDLAVQPLAVKRVPLISPEATLRETCTRCPYALAVAPDGLVWVANLGPSNGAAGLGSVALFDPRAGVFDPARIARVSGRAMSVTLLAGPDQGHRALVSEQGPDGDRLHLFGAPTGNEPPPELAVVDLAPAECIRPRAVALATDGPPAYLLCEGNHSEPGSLVWFDFDPLVTRGFVPVGVYPVGIASNLTRR